MASQLYPSMREKLLLGIADWDSGVIRALLVSSNYNPDFTNVYLSDIPAAARIAISDPLGGRSSTNGYANSGPAKFPLLFDERLVSKAIVFKDTGVEGSSELFFFLDAPELVTDPFVPIGLDYYIYPNAAEGGWFRI